MQHAASFSHDQGCANGLFLDATKNYGSGNNALKAVHLHDDMKNYGSEIEAMCPFSGKPLDTTMVIMLHRKVMWQDQSTPPGANPLNRLTHSKQAENLSVGKTKNYGTNNNASHCPPAKIEAEANHPPPKRHKKIHRLPAHLCLFIRLYISLYTAYTLTLYILKRNFLYIPASYSFHHGEK